jgi:anti-sigma factor RsiW
MPRVSALHDGELSGEESLLLCAHVQTCQACGEMLAFLERVSTTFSAADARGLLRLAPGHALPDRERQRSFRSPADVRWARRLAAVAAALFLAAVGRTVYVQYSGDSGMSSPLNRLQHPVNQVVPGQASPASSTRSAADSTGVE